MSQDARQVLSPNSRRPLREQALVHFPVLADLVTAATLRLTPGTSLRRRVIKELFRAAWDGINRGDFEPALLVYERDVEVRVFGAAGVGLADSYSGQRGWLNYFSDLLESFDEPFFEARRIVDGGDRLVAEVAFSGSGKLSGAPFELATCHVYYLSRRGKITRQESFWVDGSWDEALQAAGLQK